MTDSLDTSDREAEDPREPIRLPVREMRDEPVPHQAADPLRSALQLALEATPEELPAALNTLRAALASAESGHGVQVPQGRPCKVGGPCVPTSSSPCACRGLAAPEAPARASNLTAELQQRCSDWGVYWRAPDAHGVVLTVDQATELLRDALGVEVEVINNGPSPSAPHTQPAQVAQPGQVDAQAEVSEALVAGHMDHVRKFGNAIACAAADTQALRAAVEANFRAALSHPEAPKAAGEPAVHGEVGGLPPFDDLPDEAIDEACAAGALYRLDFLRAWEALRASIATRGA